MACVIDSERIRSLRVDCVGETESERVAMGVTGEREIETWAALKPEERSGLGMVMGCAIVVFESAIIRNTS